MLIEFGEINYKIFILLLYPLFIHLRKIIPELINDNYYFDLFRFYLSYILSSIFLLIIKKRTQTTIINKNSSNNNEPKLNIKQEDWINPLIIKKKNTIKSNNIKNIVFIILLILVGLITNLFYIIFRIIYVDGDEDEEFSHTLKVSKQSIGSLLEIIYFLILGKFILNNKLYKHHFVSLIIMIINIVLLISFAIDKKGIFKVIPYYLLYNFLFCLSYILGKKYLTIFYIAPYDLMVKIGISTSILLLIYDIIAYLIAGEKNKKIHGIILGLRNNLKKSLILYFIFDILLYFLTNIGIWLTVYYFTPFHFIISESISEYIYYSYDYMQNKGNFYKKKDIILYYLVYAINFFFALVFNEIIILKFCRLNYNTKKYIKEREREDIKLLSLPTIQSYYSRNTSLHESYVNN